MLTQISPTVIEIAVPMNDWRFQSFIRDLSNSIPPENIQFNPDQNIYYVDIMSELTLYNLYRKYYQNPEQIGLFNENYL
jgi:hypothetical protein